MLGRMAVLLSVLSTIIAGASLSAQGLALQAQREQTACNVRGGLPCTPPPATPESDEVRAARDRATVAAERALAIEMVTLNRSGNCAAAKALAVRRGRDDMSRHVGTSCK